MPLWGFLLSFLAAAMWAVSPIMVNHGVAISKCSIHEINPYRAVPFFAASLIIALINTGGDITLVTSPLVYLYLFAGVFAGYLLGVLFYFVAIREIGVSLAIPVANGYPILVIFTSWLLLGEPVTAKILWGVIVVVFGVLLLRFGGEGSKETNDVARALHNKRRLMKGFAFAIAAGCCWALSAPLTKLVIVTSGLSPTEVTFYPFLRLSRHLRHRAYSRRKIPAGVDGPAAKSIACRGPLFRGSVRYRPLPRLHRLRRLPGRDAGGDRNGDHGDQSLYRRALRPFRPQGAPDEAAVDRRRPHHCRLRRRWDIGDELP